MKTRHCLLSIACALFCIPLLSAMSPAEPKLQQKLDEIILPTMQFRNATIEEAVEYLRVKSREFDQKTASPVSGGVSFILNKDKAAKTSISLDLKDIPLGVALRYCVEAAGLKYRVDARAVMIAASFEPKFSPPILDNAAAIIFPAMQFEGATLEEAVEYLRVKSRMLDSTKKGINILIKPGGVAAEVTLDLRDIPLSDALGYVADLSRCKLTTDGHAYILNPPQAK
ncbi:MAG: hypothetical protein J0L73_15005 [Verrucomicrobia bacterium]|nr:hypothetical protein [Verrucomicrobiota bacterium]